MYRDFYVVELEKRDSGGHNIFEPTFVMKVSKLEGVGITGKSYGKGYSGTIVGRIEESALVFSLLAGLKDGTYPYFETHAENPQRAGSYVGKYWENQLEGAFKITSLEALTDVEIDALKKRIEFPES